FFANTCKVLGHFIPAGKHATLSNFKNPSHYENLWFVVYSFLFSASAHRSSVLASHAEVTIRHPDIYRL
ncbi:MAG: hypothetical protein KA160_04625, partial [Lacibacter sp.]|nr:hypothetical protein [Lacibacter sp.]